jgi:transposase
MARLTISDQDRNLLERWLSDDDVPERLATRARVVLSLADGTSDREVARTLSVARQTVSLWRRRVMAAGAVSVITTDAPGRGRKPSVPAEQRAAVCEAWRRGQTTGRLRSVRDLAREFALSPATVHRALKAGGCQAGGGAPVAERESISRHSAAADEPVARETSPAA